MATSSRIRAADAAFAAVKHFHSSSRYAERRFDPAISDFTFGNPHELPLPGLVAAIRERAQPHDKNWFAYKTSEQEPQAFIAEHVGKELGLAFDPADIALTTGAFAAIMVAFHHVLDAGDEAIFSEPAWFCYEPLLLAAAAVPRKVALRAPAFDLDLGAIDAAIGPRTRLVIVNTPHNPTGRIYSREIAGEAGGPPRTRLRPHRPPHLPALGRTVSPATIRRQGVRQSGSTVSVDVHRLQLRQGSARSRAKTRLSGDFAPDAGGGASSLQRFDVCRANGSWLVLSECRHAVRRTGSRDSLDRSGRAGTTARSADERPGRERLRGPAARRHVLSVDASGPQATRRSVGTSWPIATSSSCQAAS